MTDRVVRLLDLASDVNEDLVCNLEELLADARAGRLKEFHGFGEFRDGSMVTSWCPTDDIYRQIGLCERLKKRMLDSVRALE